MKRASGSASKEMFVAGGFAAFEVNYAFWRNLVYGFERKKGKT